MSSTTTKFDKLGKENYDTWMLQMKASLIKCELWKYVNGTDTQPEPSASGYAIWKLNDEKALSKLILSISTSELKHIKKCSTSREAWLELKMIFQSHGPARKLSLLLGVAVHKMKAGENLNEHWDRFMDYVDKLEEIDIKIDDDLLSLDAHKFTTII